IEDLAPCSRFTPKVALARELVNRGVQGHPVVRVPPAAARYWPGPDPPRPLEPELLQRHADILGSVAFGHQARPARAAALPLHQRVALLHCWTTRTTAAVRSPEGEHDTGM